MTMLSFHELSLVDSNVMVNAQSGQLGLHAVVELTLVLAGAHKLEKLFCGASLAAGPQKSD